MDFTVDLGNIIALIALLLGIYSAFKSRRLKSLQEEVMLIEKDLKELMLEKEREETSSSFKADLSANIIKLGTGKSRLKIYNKGKGIATNVRFEEIGDSDIMIMDEDIFPLEFLEPFQSVEVIISPHAQSARKMKIKLTWDDESGRDLSKDVVVTR